MEFATLTMNRGARVRKVTSKSGTTYLVAPLTMIVPGVLNGSRGRLYYSKKEIARNYEAWNGMPLTLRHPMRNGEPVSARNPRVLERVGLGHVYNARVTEDGKLKAEGWFNEKSVRRKAPEVYNALVNGKKLELSTGLYTKNIPAALNARDPRTGKEYDYIATSYKPDHLAILPDQVGACSLDDGCGVLVNAKKKNKGNPSSSLDMTPEKACKILKDGTVHGKPLTEKQRGMFGALCGKRKKKVPTKNVGSCGCGCGTCGDKKKGDRSVLSTGGDDMTTVNKKKLVRWLATNCETWKGAEATLMTMNEKHLAKLKAEAEKANENELIANAAKKGFTDPGGTSHVWNEETGEWESKEKTPTNNDKNKGYGKKGKKMEDPDDDDDDEEEEAPKKKKGKQTNNRMSLKEWEESMPDEAKPIWNAAKDVEYRERASLVKTIVANGDYENEKEKKADAAELMKEPVANLRKMVKRLGKKRTDNSRNDDDDSDDAALGPAFADFFGAAGSDDPMVGNRSGKSKDGFDPDDILELPTINYEELAAEQRGKKGSFRRKPAEDDDGDE